MTKSITAIIVLSMLATPAQAEEPTVMRTYQAMTQVEPRCSVPRAGSEIVVCGRRRADRWRVPYLLKEDGDPSIQNVSAERNGLIPTRTPCQDRSIFLVGCGKVGLSVSTAIGGGSGVKLRPLAD
jgi:hypothetical protein